MALKRQQRIQGAAGVTRIYSGARPLHSGCLSLRVIHTRQGGARFAVTVPVSIAPRAVERNALRRRITERLRLLLAGHNTADGVRVVISARTQVRDAVEISNTLVLLLNKSGILQQ